jgi:hypothetical protein
MDVKISWDNRWYQKVNGCFYYILVWTDHWFGQNLAWNMDFLSFST